MTKDESDAQRLNAVAMTVKLLTEDFQLSHPPRLLFDQPSDWQRIKTTFLTNPAFVHNGALNQAQAYNEIIDLFGIRFQRRLRDRPTPTHFQLQTGTWIEYDASGLPLVKALRFSDKSVWDSALGWDRT